jgi:hypothetical protein
MTLFVDTYIRLLCHMNLVHIAMETYMRALQKMLKINNYLRDLYVVIAMDVKNQQLFTRPICGYYIFKMALWKLE